jgi:hypothetical protein
MKGEGATVWLIPDGYLPPRGEGPLEGHEAICLLNTGERDAHVSVDLYFEDREPVLGIPVVVGARRTLHLRTDRPAMLGGFEVPRGIPYAIRVRSDVPITVQYSRMDTSQPNLTLMTTLGYPVDVQEGSSLAG